MSDSTPDTAATTVRERMLQAVDDEALSWNRPGMRSTSYRLWLDDNNYRTLTKAERRAVEALIAEGVVRTYMAAGYSYASKGGIERAPRSVRNA